MKTTTSSGHTTAPNADPNAPQQNPTGAPGVPAAASTANTQDPPRSFNVKRPAPAVKPGPAAVGATQDTVAQSTTSKVAMPGNPPAPKAPTAAKGPSPGSRQPLRAKSVDPAKLGAEDLVQRLRYFENLAETHVAYIKTLQGLVTRTGTAIPAMPHVKPFLSPAGNVDPNVQVAVGG